MIRNDVPDGQGTLRLKAKETYCGSVRGLPSAADAPRPWGIKMSVPTSGQQARTDASSDTICTFVYVTSQVRLTGVNMTAGARAHTETDQHTRNTYGGIHKTGDLSGCIDRHEAWCLV